MKRNPLASALSTANVELAPHDVDSRQPGAYPRRLSVDAFSRQEGYTPGQVRWWLFNRESNGLQAAGACESIGRRIYINLAGFERWIASQNQQAAA